MAVDGLKTDHGVLLKDVEGVAARVEQVDRNMDQVESWSAPRVCASKADKVLEQGAWGLQEVRGGEKEEEWEELHSQVSGELRKGNGFGFDRSSPFKPADYIGYSLFSPELNLAAHKSRHRRTSFSPSRMGKKSQKIWTKSTAVSGHLTASQ